ncbi:MAG: flavodoxin [Clostridium sp.]|nr:flavodoxin [Clostridium sp.]
MAGEEKRALIACFSWSGNTEALAELIQEQTGGDLYKITTATPYTEDYDALLAQAQEEQKANARPELDGQVENWEDYDVIFVGYPNRRSDAPMAALTFLESYDFNGKTLIPFCTNGSGVFGRSLSSVEKSAWGGTNPGRL